MFIQKIKSSYGNDFTATMGCEWCDHTQELKTGYNDANYHERVIPEMTCGGCGKNRAGDVPQERNDNGQRHVA